MYLIALKHFRSSVEVETVWEDAATARLLMEAFPEFVAGFDLVGEEDKGKPLIDFISPLLNISAEHIPFFFHAGETSKRWCEKSVIKSKDKGKVSD